MNLSLWSLTIEGGGKMMASDLHVEATDLTIDAGGVLSLSGEGYKLADGSGQGVNGAINFGRGTSSQSGSSGGGHGGTAGRGSATDYVGLPYGNLYEPADFGSSGGGVTGLKGKNAHSVSLDPLTVKYIYTGSIFIQIIACVLILKQLFASGDHVSHNCLNKLIGLSPLLAFFIKSSSSLQLQPIE
jgi:hypothetical protein